MNSPCELCYAKFGKLITDECDKDCEFAKIWKNKKSAEIKKHHGRPYTLTRHEAASEIEAADDPQLFEMGCEVAIKALRTDVPIENINEMIAAIDKLRKIIVKDEDGEADIYCSMTEVFKIVNYYGTHEERGENGKA